MSPRPVAASAGDVHAALASPARRRLLALLQSAPTAREVEGLAVAVGLHSSTVRFHLETMRHAGLVVRVTQPPDGRGRPRTAYAAVEAPDNGGGYQGLATVLAAGLADTPEERSGRAERIGEDWAGRLIGAHTPVDASLEEAALEVSALFERLGFAPELGSSEHGREIALHACPFRTVARDHTEVVCSVHLGLLRGSLARLGAPTTPRLLPFVEPELCMVHLGPAQ